MRKANLFRDNYGELRDWVPAIVAALVFVILIACLFGGAFFSARQECIQIGETLGIRVEWRVFARCFLELDGRMIPYDTWKYLQVQGLPE